jgi:KAP family P-loop domain
MKPQSGPESSGSNTSASEKMEVSTQLCPTRLVDDSPAENDELAFHGDIGPHKRVAQAIAEIIRTPVEAGGKMVGLEGGWGAGKTTVINLLRKELLSNQEITVFSFDAWAHEGDPLRRTYLESLIRHFQSIPWVNQKDWDECVEDLAKRRRSTSTRTTPVTTTLGKWFAISVFLVPLGSPFLVDSLSHPIMIDPKAPIAWKFIFGLAITGAPLLVLLGNLIRIYFNRMRSSGDAVDPKNSAKGKEDKVSDWAFLAGSTISETKQNTTETAEPTSIEFESTFRRLMRAALPQGSNRQAVVVLDNLDRVAPRDALSIWATLQTFLQNQSIQKEQWLNKLWIIVPYDPSGLRRLWENHRNRNQNKNDQSDQEEEIDNELRGSAERQHVVADSFMDKSFQLRFEVSPPILSNWKAYLTTLVKSALPEHDIEDQHMIYRVFDLCQAKDGVAPTPRELKLYVNQIGVIHRQWQHEFPVGHIAYYVSLRRSHEDICSGLRAGNLPESNLAAILPPKLGENLAGLAFNVQAHLGQQLVLGEPIKDALAKNDAARLRELEMLHGEGFWAVLEEFAASRMTDFDATMVANTASCLDKSEVLKGSHSREARTVIQALKRSATNVKSWSPFDENLAKGIGATCRLILDMDMSKQIIGVVRSTIREDAIQPNSQVKILGLAFLCEEFHKIGHQEAVLTPFTLPIDAKAWVEACPQIGKQNSQWWSIFRPNAKFEDISQILSSIVPSGEFRQDGVTAVEVTQSSFGKGNWDSLATAIDQRLNANQNPNSQEVNCLMLALVLLRRFKCKQAPAVLKRLADSGHLMHRLHQAQSDIECRARCIATFLEQRPDAAKPQNVGSSDAGYNDFTNTLNSSDADLAKHMVDMLQTDSGLHLLLKIRDERKKYDPLIVQCLRAAADDDGCEGLYTPPTVVERWRDFRENLGDNQNVDRFNKLIIKLCDRTSLIEDVQNAEQGFKYEDSALYLAICRAPSSGSFREWCRDGLEGLSAVTWRAELENEGDALRLMLALGSEGVSVTLKQPYQDALVDHAKGVLSGTLNPSDDLVKQNLSIFAGLGTASARTVLRRRILDAAIDRDGKCADRFFEMYGQEIGEGGTLSGTSDTVDKLFSPLLRERAVGGLHWLSGLLATNPNFLTTYTDAASVQDFTERLQGELQKPTDEGDQAQLLINNIAKTLGIGLKEEASVNPTEIENEKDNNDPKPEK